MNTLWLLKFNNYYNRIVKKFDSLSDYQGYQVKYKGQTTDPNGNTAVILNVNFVEGDFVNTTQIVNWAGELPDYLIVSSDGQSIDSRWFVTDCTKTRMGQLQLTLHRDLVVDFYESVKDAPIFVEKGTLLSSSPLIYNSEDMGFNQIKKSETPIKDQSGCPWIILYTDQKTRLQTTVDSLTENVAVTYSSVTEFLSSPIYQAYNSEQHFIGSPKTIQYIRWRIPIKYNNSVYYIDPSFYFDSYRYINVGSASANDLTTYLKSTIPYNSTTVRFTADKLTEMVMPGVEMLEQGLPVGLQADFAAQGFIVNENTYNDCTALANQTVKVMQSNGTAKYYRIICTPTTTTRYAVLSDQNIWNAIKSNGIAMGLLQASQPTTPSNDLYVTLNGYTIDIQETSIETLNVDILPINYTKDAPYNILAIPFSDTLKIKNSLTSSFTQVTANKSLSLNTAKSLILSFAGAGALYDAQILPYCPLTSSVMDVANNTLDIKTSNASGWTLVQTTGGAIKGYIFRIDYSSFSRFIPLQNPISISNRKIENLTDLYRLSSPNFSTNFEFSAAKNNGISGFAVSCTYKPFTPYIKIRPDFKGLYGADFDDSRGLILGGDYSLPMTTDAWKTYELQNKNYQASFDRQIQSMEVNNNIDRQAEKWQSGAGTLSAIASGVSGGLASPLGLLGGVVGGVASGIISAVAGNKDIEFNEARRREAMSLAKDQFGYQLGNIKALPIGLSKTSAYNIDNKYFPFLEYYSCTDQEKLALALKIRNNGMTVGMIGKWSDYLNNTWSYTLVGYGTITDRGYFKGKLIALEGANVDSHIAAAIASEFYQGVYLR